eukprot:2922679-Alexandrium_andersonii.AAC.1
MCIRDSLKRALAHPSAVVPTSTLARKFAQPHLSATPAALRSEFWEGPAGQLCNVGIGQCRAGWRVGAAK